MYILLSDYVTYLLLSEILNSEQVIDIIDMILIVDKFKANYTRTQTHGKYINCEI